MPINLQKGQKIDLTKGNPGLSKITVGLGWDTNRYDGGDDFDLDACAFVLNATGKVNSEKDFIFYGNLQNDNGSIIHNGDNKTGEGEGDDVTLDPPFEFPSQAVISGSIFNFLHS